MNFPFQNFLRGAFDPFQRVMSNGMAPGVQPGLSAPIPGPAPAVQPGLSAPMLTSPWLMAPSQQNYSISPSQQPFKMDFGKLANLDWGKLAATGSKIMEQGQASKQAPQQQQQPMLQPQVLQPMRRVTLGKGLLG